MSARIVPGANVIRRQTSEEAQGGRAVAESAASADVPWRSTEGSRFVAEQREPGAGVLTPNGRSADTRYDNHQEASPALVVNSSVFPHVSSRCPAESDSVLPTAKFPSAGSPEAVTIRFIQVFFMQIFGSKSSKEMERETEKIMVARTFVILSRLLLIVAALCGGIALVGAQTTTNPQFIPQTTVQAPAQSKSANSPLLPQKMKRTTNDMRRAAAARHADRRAAQLRKHHGQVK